MALPLRLPRVDGGQPSGDLDFHGARPRASLSIFVQIFLGDFLSEVFQDPLLDSSVFHVTLNPIIVSMTSDFLCSNKCHVPNLVS